MSGAPTAKTIRMYCDGELAPQEAAEVEKQLLAHPECRARAEFERKLQECVGEALRTGCPEAPPQLADRVREGLAEAPGHGGAAWWRGPYRANVFAVAASLILVVAAVLFGIFGTPIDYMRGRGLVDVSAEAAAAVAGEHVRWTANLPAMAGGLRFRTPELARRGLDLGEAEATFDLSDLGYKFVGGDTCDVPHCERGCHLFYRATGATPGLVSLHIVADRGQFDRKGEVSPLELPLVTTMIPENPACPNDVLIWVHGQRAYLLVVCVPGDVRRVAQRVQETLVAGGPAGRR